MDLHKYQYDMFLALESIEDYKVQNYINESILLNENNVEDFEMLQESTIEVIKNGITKLLNVLAGIWNRFLARIKELTLKNQKYLEEYKDVILNKKVTGAKYTLYNYEQGIKDLLAVRIPQFNYTSMKDNLVNAETFIKSSPSLRRIAGNAKDPKMIDLAKTLFRGGDQKVTIDSEKINMKLIYDYCYNYKNISKEIKSDISYIEEAGREAKNAIDKAARNDKFKNESFNFLNEVEINTDGKVGSKTTDENKNKEDQVSGKNQTIDKDNAQHIKEDDVADSTKTAKEVQASIKVYLKVCGDVLAAKQTIAEECYKEYMTLIRYHVKTLTGKTGKEDDKAKENKKPEEKVEPEKEVKFNDN